MPRHPQPSQFAATIPAGEFGSPFFGPPVSLSGGDTGGGGLTSAGAGAIGAGIFAVIAAFGAAKQAQAIANAARLSMDRVNLFITNLRVNKILAIAQIAYDGQRALGNLTNAVSPTGISKQESLMNQVNDPTAFATWTEYESLKREERAAHDKKIDIAAAANAGTPSVPAAAANAAASGYSIATEAFTAWKNSQNADEINGIQQGQYKSQRAGWRIDLKGLESAIRDSGIRFDTFEAISGLAAALHAGQQQLGVLETIRADRFADLQTARGRTIRNFLNNSSIGSLNRDAEVPANLSDLTLDFSGSR